MTNHNTPIESKNVFQRVRALAAVATLTLASCGDTQTAATSDEARPMITPAATTTVPLSLPRTHTPEQPTPVVTTLPEAPEDHETYATSEDIKKDVESFVRLIDLMSPTERDDITFTPALNPDASVTHTYSQTYMSQGQPLTEVSVSVVYAEAAKHDITEPESAVAFSISEKPVNPDELYSPGFMSLTYSLINDTDWVMMLGDNDGMRLQESTEPTAESDVFASPLTLEHANDMSKRVYALLDSMISRKGIIPTSVDLRPIPLPVPTTTALPETL